MFPKYLLKSFRVLLSGEENDYSAGIMGAHSEKELCPIDSFVGKFKMLPLEKKSLLFNCREVFVKEALK